MKTKQIKLLLLLGSMILSLNLFAFSNFKTFESITVAEGLNNNTIYDLVRDSKGYIWLSTDMGISRYDGFHSRNFPLMESVSSDKSSAPVFPQAVTRIYPDVDDLFYLQMRQGGIACFDNVKETYLPVHFSRSLGSTKINGLYKVDNYILYIAASDGLYNAEVKRVKKGKEESLHVVLKSTPLLKGNISLLCGDDQGNLFFVSDGKKVVHYSMGTQQIKEIVRTTPRIPVSQLYAEGDYLWICSQSGSPVCYNVKRETSRVIKDISEESSTRLSDTSITGITNVDGKKYYLSTWNGLFQLEFDSENIGEASYTLESVTQGKREKKAAIENKMTTLMWDKDQHILWIGTFGGGMVKASSNKEEAYSCLLQDIDAEVDNIEEDNKGFVWLSTQRKGIWRSATNVFSSKSQFIPWTKGVNASETYRMYKDKNGNIWLGDEDAGIIFIDPQTEEVIRYPLTPEGVKTFSGNANQFCLDSRERLWIVTSQGVLLFDYKTKRCQLVLKYDKELKDVTALVEDKEGEIWLGTNMGLKRLELQSGTFNLVGDYEQQVGLAPDIVTSVYVNSYNQIFAAYIGKLIRIDGREKKQVESVFALTNDLNSGHILCIVDDNNGNTWVGTNSGIMTIRNDRTSFYNYPVSGCYGDVCRLRDGRLLWADSWGLVFFDPLVVKNQPDQKTLILSDLRMNGNSVSVGEKVNGQVILSAAPDTQQEFIFDSSNGNISFYFSDRQYNMMQRKVAYRLLPDEEWKVCPLEDGIHYSHLNSGKYTLQVKIVYPDANEGDLLEIPVIVKAPWWATIWAFIAYIILAAGIYVLVRHCLFAKKRRNLSDVACEAPVHEKQETVEQELIEQEIVESEIVEQKTEQKPEKDEIHHAVLIRFMKELRTPLSIIVTPLREVLQEKNLSKGLSTRMLIAYRNSIGMMNACEQLLNVYDYKPSEGEVKLAPYSIVKVIDSLLFSINEFLRVHPINFQYEKKVKKDLEVWIDKKGIELVIQNLLYNAFTHIQYDGAVVLVLQEVVEEDVIYSSITIVDNGKSEVKILEELPYKDTESLLRVSATEVETGYEVMKHIMKQHHGTISLENIKSGGTKVQIKWPVAKTVFEQDESVVFIEPDAQEDISPMVNALNIKTNENYDEMELTEGEPNVTLVERTRKTLLVVEDYKDIRLYLKTLFEKEYNVLLASNGEEGVNLAKSEVPDLIICDVMMPVKDGYECCKEVKENLDTCHIPFILLTAKVEENDIIKGLEIGADDYILKPFTPKVLQVKVRNLIEGRSNLKRMYTQLLVTPSDELNAIVAEDNKVEIEDPFISTVVKIVEENIQEPDFNVKKLAADLNMSQPTLYRKVKQCTDFTIIELIRGVRMRKAATLLKNKQYPVQEVVEMVGYNDIPTFRKHFVDTYGTTPSTYADSDKQGKAAKS